MKTLLTTLNAKYIHKALALRLLYNATKKENDVIFKEFTIKDDIQKIVQEILNLKVDIVSFSIYIWNINEIKEVIEQLKKIKPTIKIIVGGPEVSYEIDHFLDHFEIDYAMSGEGEETLNALLKMIENNHFKSQPGISSKEERNKSIAPLVPIDLLESLDSPYVLQEDLQDMDKRILYFETSRGCPYRCAYCLSSLEKGLRFYTIPYLENQLEQILKTNVKTIKFLDRSFNASTKHALAILEIIKKMQRFDVSYQFEINGDVLDQKIIDFIHDFAPPGVIRFEIGIQSTYEPTNKIVQRYQDFERLKEVILQLQDKQIIDLHLDLIAGLPLETKDRFAKSFDDVFNLYPKELQLGFLKLLRGTSLRKNADQYGYIYEQDAPYELIKGNDLSQDDIAQIHLAEDMLEKYWNSGKFNETMKKIKDNIDSPFNFFLDFGKFYQKNEYKKIHYQNDELFTYLQQYCLSIQMDVEDELIIDYLTIARVKPKQWWQSRLNKNEYKPLIHKIIEKTELNAQDLFKYSKIEVLRNHIVIAVYKNFNTKIYKLDKKSFIM